MTRQIRMLGAGLLCCFLLLFLQLNRLTVLEADSLNDHPLNTRAILRDFNQPRGDVSTADEVVIARSVPSEGRFALQRVYGPQRRDDAEPALDDASLYAHITGFYSFSLGSSGVERTYNDELAGRTLDLQIRNLADLFVDRDRVGNLTLTIRDDVQQVARDALGDQEGAVVALDPRTGAVLALWSFPSYDPNLLADHDLAAATAVQELLDDHAGRPRRARTYQERYFPGSTFKVVTAGAGLVSGTVTPTQPSYPASSGYTAPGTTRAIRNFGGGTCGGTLHEIMRISCNTAFAQMAVDVGADQMIRTAEAFGFNQDVPLDLTSPVRSNFPTDFERNLPALAQSGIGQFEVAATPLQMAMVAAGVANDGVVMAPHVLGDVRDDDANVVDSHDPREWRRAVDPGTAAHLRESMLETVRQGTAQGLQTPGLVVGGKTGTAQLGTDPPSSHAWIIGFAGPEGEAPQVAVAVIVEGQPGISELTGGRIAAPIAQAVMASALEPPQ